MQGLMKQQLVRSRLSLHLAGNGFTVVDRLTYGAISIGSTAAILLGRVLTPSPTGVGTHQQLGLPACPMLHLTGFPCPSCGLTTSFSHAARMEFLQAFQVQPFGLLAFFLAIFAVPACLYLTVRRVPVNDLIFSRRSNPIMTVLLLAYLCSWLYKTATMVF